MSPHELAAAKVTWYSPSSWIRVLAVSVMMVLTLLRAVIVTGE